MKHARLLKANTAYYRRYYRLIMAATLVMTAILTGSLMIGHSVRHTLISRVKERLGNTQTVIFSRHAFFESRLADAPSLGTGAQPVLLTNGFVSSAGRLIPVTVWGMDNKDVPPGSAKINSTLATELALDTQPADDLVLRLPATGLAPAGSLFVTDNYTTALRLSFAGIVGNRPEAGGNLNLKNEQIIPNNIFLNRTELASALGIQGKINLILSDRHISADTLAKAWNPALSGIRQRMQNGGYEITSDRIFLQHDMVANIAKNNRNVNHLFSYMANAIASQRATIPYSFVTAIDEYNGKRLQNDEIILSDYAAARLHAEKNDSIKLTFFVSGDLKTLREDTLVFRVAEIVPIRQLSADPTLSAEFPGLSDVDKCTDWDSDMPIDMNRITPDDEDYWTAYRATPKALIAYATAANRWSNVYGSATALRMSDQPDMSSLEPSMLGIQLIYPKDVGLAAAQNGIDFASLFLSLGIFIVFSAVMLMLVPLSEMIVCRSNELSLLRALGFSGRRMVKLLWRESLVAVVRASPAGVVAGVCYTALVLVLLNTLWNGAVHTGGFAFFPSLPTMLTGWAAGTGIALALLRIAIVRAVKQTEKPRPAIRLRRQREKPFSRIRLIGAGLRADKKRVWLSFATLASGVLIVFSVGLNRRGFSDGSQLLSGTGGYSLWCESSVPIYHNINTPEGRAKLALNGLPDDVQALQLFRYGADDASCLNLNKVTQPTVLGIDMESLKNSHFKAIQSIYADDVSVFDALRSATVPVYPVMVDETTLLWGLQRKTGDTIRYETSDGKVVYLQLAVVMQNSVFQGNLLMDKKLFSEVWSEIAGAEIVLLKAKTSDVEAVQRHVSQALGEYGVRIMPAARRLKEFNSVTDTYLTIFLTLGGLGLLIGVASLVVVVRKNLASRGEQVTLYRSLGFADSEIAGLLTAENRIVPVSAIAFGVAASLAGISGSMANVSLGVWVTALIFMAALMACTWIFVKKAVERQLSSG